MYKFSWIILSRIILYFVLYFFVCIIYRLLFLIIDLEFLYILLEYDNVGNFIKVIFIVIDITKFLCIGKFLFLIGNIKYSRKNGFFKYFEK